jgi:hypothetical protein
MPLLKNLKIRPFVTENWAFGHFHRYEMKIKCNFDLCFYVYEIFISQFGC